MAKTQNDAADQERISSSRDDATRGPLSSLRADPERAQRNIMDMTNEEREQFLRDEFSYQALPTVPKIPGFHTCWLSTTNQSDTIMRRMRIGYTPVTVEEMPHLKSISLKTGEYAGHIGMNEMLLFKIPEEWYQQMMKHFHHDQPLEEEEKLRRLHEQIKSGQMSKGKPIIAEIGEGTEELLRKDTRRPSFQ